MKTDLFSNYFLNLKTVKFLVYSMNVRALSLFLLKVPLHKICYLNYALFLVLNMKVLQIFAYENEVCFENVSIFFL